MPALGQKLTFSNVRHVSALPPKADITSALFMSTRPSAGLLPAGILAGGLFPPGRPLGVGSRDLLLRVRSFANGRSSWPALLQLSDAIQQAACEPVFLAGIEGAASHDPAGQRA